MKKMKKIVAFLVAMCMVLSMASVAYAEESELGAYDNPWQLSTMDTRFAVYVEPGDTQYVQVNDCNGTTASVGYVVDETGAYNYMIQYGRLNTYYPDAEGLLSFQMEQMGGDMFSVYNAGETAITVYMSLTAGAPADTTGTMEDPEELVLTEGWFGINAMDEQQLAAGNQGYYYTVEAIADGILTVGVNAIDADYNYIGWMYSVNIERADGTYSYGDIHWSDDDEPAYYEDWTVSAGDVATIYVSTYNPDDMWNAPEGTVICDVTLSPVGTWTNPAELVLGDNIVNIAAGGSAYYYTWTATEDGVATFSVSTADEIGWNYAVDVERADGTFSYGDYHWSDDDVVVASEVVEVSAGDVVTIWAVTYDPADWNAPAGTVTVNLSFEVPEEETTTPEETTPEETTPEEETTTEEEETTTEVEEETTTEEETTEAGETVVTGDVSTTTMMVVMLAAAAAIVVLKKRALN